jgi:hypothetical protein
MQQKSTLGKIKGLFRQPEAADRLETWKQEFRRMVELFKVCQTNVFQCIFKLLASLQAQVTGSTLAQMGKMKKDAKEQHEQLVAFLEAQSDLTNSDCSSVSGKL